MERIVIVQSSTVHLPPQRQGSFDSGMTCPGMSDASSSEKIRDNKKMKDSLFEFLVSEPDHVSKARLLIYRLTELASVNKKHQIVYTAAVSDLLQDMIRQSDGFLDVGVSCRGDQLFVETRILPLNPGAWGPRKERILNRREYHAQLIEDKLMQLSVASETLDSRPGSEQLQSWEEELRDMMATDFGTSMLVGEPKSEVDEEPSREELKRLQEQLKEVNRAVFALFDELEEKNRELARAQEEAEEKKQKAEEANRAKTQFLYQISHDIRTPLNAITGMVDLLQHSDLTSEQQQYVRIFDQAAETLLDLVNDLLDLSRIEAGVLKLSEKVVDLRMLIGECLSLFTRRAHENNNELTADIESDCPSRIMADPKRLKQILVNLISNAVKHTEEGRIEVRVRPTGNHDDRVLLNWEVSDTGEGIPPEQQQKIFETFRRLKEDEEERDSGAGLGLSITKRLVEQMNGSIDVESAPGEGTTFQFQIPFSLPDEKDESTDHYPESTDHELDFTGQQILVADDHSATVLILTHMLEEWGASVTTVGSGEQLINHVEEEAGTYDALLVNAHMSDLEGYDLLEKLDSSLDLDHVILITTADRESADRQQASKYGITQVITRPMERSYVLKALAGVLEIAGEEQMSLSSSSATEWSVPEDWESIHLLIAEDNKVNRRVMAMYLDEEPIRIDFAENGQEAVNKFRNKAYDLVFMDLRMPEMDGIEATRRIRKLEQESNRTRTPIMALTAEAHEKQKQETARAGCDAHVVKPVSREEILDVIKNELSESNGGVPASDAEEDSIDENGAGVTEAERGETPDAPLDVNEEFRELVPEFVSEARSDVQSLLEALDEEDGKTIADKAHKLKGSSGFYGFDELVEWMKEIEEAVELKDFDRIRSLTKSASERVERIEEELT